jgi:hypothetical protein
MSTTRDLGRGHGAGNARQARSPCAPRPSPACMLARPCPLVLLSSHPACGPSPPRLCPSRRSPRVPPPLPLPLPGLAPFVTEPTRTRPRTRPTREARGGEMNEGFQNVSVSTGVVEANQSDSPPPVRSKTSMGAGPATGAGGAGSPSSSSVYSWGGGRSRRMVGREGMRGASWM